eukprot:Gregarina_sp_Poly_1__7595@NODE_425_length_8620_cov_281_527534_g346_i0_p4_GENE_NODE_425_length_8620_cov_281_527534_g346_i0NODE_425_length_8620_cov_281_527534_g346_i0_p4_ORF_typecomplete_len306_score48_80DUF4168/PF13767_6/11DUF4168/PF13767_6/3_8DUF4168/PF13767_6/3_6e02DUF1160/PF06648_11/0_17DUF1160/PF06648_11/4_9e02PgaD/PF13994_6/0_11PAP_PilO/PF06864_12/0_19PAP_PilO/PF06864_12/6_5e02Hormone_1/PF00103_20/58Hormone_1/PF00103_20/5CHASE6_C/PF17150_4/4_2CHASE6_C/PF17150_4/2e02_NODE_425_length_8620_cov_
MTWICKKLPLLHTPLLCQKINSIEKLSWRRHSMKQSAFLSVIKTVAAVTAVACVAVYAYNRYTAREETKGTVPTTTERDVTKNIESAEAQAPGSPKIDLKKASRETVLQLLREIVKVQRELSATMQDVIQRITTDNLSPDATYELVAQQQPIDPLEKNGLSIADFDSLLDRFAQDEEVHAAIVEVVQGPDQSGAAPSLKSDNQALTVDRIVEINLTMLDKFKSVIEHFKERMKTNPEKYNPRTVSITAQAVVGAHVQREFNVTADDVEKGMLVYQLELSMRQDFLQANDEIQKIMAECVHLGGGL